MKKRILIISIIIFTSIIAILKTNQYSLTIETYIDGKLASTMPSSSDGYKVKSLTCTTGSASFNYSAWRIETSGLTGDTTCTVEFESDNSTQYLNDYLINNKSCSSTPTNDADAKNCLVVEQEAYRYEGVDPNNYIKFNNELWRIIGVFEVEDSNGNTKYLTKIIKYDVLDVLAFDVDIKNNWENSNLQKTLNNAYLNAKDTKCYTYSTDTEKVTKTCNFSRTGLNLISRNMVESVVWHVGAITTSSGNRPIPTIYEQERGTDVPTGYSATWTGKIGLMYLSDYGYSVLASSCPRNTLVGKSGYATQNCAGNSWLFSGDQYTMSPASGKYDTVYFIDDDGYIRSSNGNIGYSTYPALYLKSGVKYVEGDGTYSNPFIIR
ncbi:MAG: hypothetical protein E7163_00480 [Firmicutes bacterium]|nr:hypothetical protein [Bacillota bacterium]